VGETHGKRATNADPERVEQNRLFPGKFNPLRVGPKMDPDRQVSPTATHVESLQDCQIVSVSEPQRFLEGPLREYNNCGCKTGMSAGQPGGRSPAHACVAPAYGLAPGGSRHMAGNHSVTAATGPCRLCEEQRQKRRGNLLTCTRLLRVSRLPRHAGCVARNDRKAAGRRGERDLSHGRSPPTTELLPHGPHSV